MPRSIKKIQTEELGINAPLSWTSRIQNTSKNPILYPHQSRITYHSLLWDTLYFTKLLTLPIFIWKWEIFGPHLLLWVERGQSGRKKWCRHLCSVPILCVYYSSNKTTKTWIQISHNYWFWLFLKYVKILILCLFYFITTVWVQLYIPLLDFFLFLFLVSVFCILVFSLWLVQEDAYTCPILSKVK